MTALNNSFSFSLLLSLFFTIRRIGKKRKSTASLYMHEKKKTQTHTFRVFKDDDDNQERNCDANKKCKEKRE
jgi:hypothetical protein